MSTPILKPPVHVLQTGVIKLTGWAVDRDARTTAAGLEAVIDGAPVPMLYGTERSDVAMYLKEPAVRLSGFSLTLPAAKFEKGHHELRIRIYTSDKRHYLDSGDFSFVID